MRFGLIIPVTLVLAACGAKSDVPPPKLYPAAPIVPELPKDLKDPCPGLNPISDGSLKALVEASAEDSVKYAACKKKALEILERYEQVKREQDSHVKQVQSFWNAQP